MEPRRVVFTARAPPPSMGQLAPGPNVRCRVPVSGLRMRASRSSSTPLRASQSSRLITYDKRATSRPCSDDLDESSSSACSVSSFIVAPVIGEPHFLGGQGAHHHRWGQPLEQRRPRSDLLNWAEAGMRPGGARPPRVSSAASSSTPLKRTRPIGRDLNAQKALADRRDRRTPLTGELKKAWGVPELWRALQKHRSELNGLNTSFALNKLAKVRSRRPSQTLNNSTPSPHPSSSQPEPEPPPPSSFLPCVVPVLCSSSGGSTRQRAPRQRRRCTSWRPP